MNDKELKIADYRMRDHMPDLEVAGGCDLSWSAGKKVALTERGVAVTDLAGSAGCR